MQTVLLTALTVGGATVLGVILGFFLKGVVHTSSPFQALFCIV